MSLLNEYIKKEQRLKQLRDELQQLEQDQRLKSELEFKDRLEALMAEYDKKAEYVIELLDPQSMERSVQKTSGSTATTSSGRRKRKLKVYKNPHTEEVIETRGGNHKTLKAWKEEYGNDTVESWIERIDS